MTARGRPSHGRPRPGPHSTRTAHPREAPPREVPLLPPRPRGPGHRTDGHPRRGPAGLSRRCDRKSRTPYGIRDQPRCPLDERGRGADVPYRRRPRLGPRKDRPDRHHGTGPPGAARTDRCPGPRAPGGRPPWQLRSADLLPARRRTLRARGMSDHRPRPRVRQGPGDPELPGTHRRAGRTDRQSRRPGRGHPWQRRRRGHQPRPPRPQDRRGPRNSRRHPRLPPRHPLRPARIRPHGPVLHEGPAVAVAPQPQHRGRGAP